MAKNGKKQLALIDTSTGELVPYEPDSAPPRSTMQFWKLNMKGFLNVLSKFENKQIRVFCYILSKTHPSTNEFGGTYREIAKACDVSLDTVERVLKLLQDAGFIMKIRGGSYFVSPDILMKGDDVKKSQLLRNYHERKNR